MIIRKKLAARFLKTVIVKIFSRILAGSVVNRTHAIKAITLLWIGSLLGAGFAFLTQMILARTLGPINYGSFAATVTFVTLLTPLAAFGVAPFWLRIFGEEGWVALRWLDSSFRFVAILTIITILMVLLWASIGPHTRDSRYLIYLLSIYILGQVAIELVSAKLQLEERYARLALWQLLPHLLRLLPVTVVVYFAPEWLSAYFAGCVFAVVALFFAAFGLVDLTRMSRGNLNLKGHSNSILASDRQKTTLVTLFKEVTPFGLATFLNLIYLRSDIVLVKYMVDDHAAGIYNLAFVILTAIYLLPGVVYSKYLLPKFHRWANDDREKFHQMYRRGNIVMLLLGSLAMFIVWATAFYLIPLAFGDAYNETVYLLNILVLSAPFVFVAFSAGATLVTQNHMRHKVKLMGVVAIVNVSLNILIIPVYGPTGAAITTVISNVILSGLYYYSSEKMVFAHK